MKVRERIRKTWKKKGFRYGAAGTLCLMLAAGIMALGSGTGARAAGTIGELNTAGGNISSASDFELLRNASSDDTSGKTYTLTQDITISSVSSAATGTFAGTFDGGGHVITIEELDITTAETVTGASEGVLFGTVTGTVQNLIVEVEGDASYTRKSDAGTTQASETPVKKILSDGEAAYTPTEPVSSVDNVSAEERDALQAMIGTLDGYDDVYIDDEGTEYDSSVEGRTHYKKAEVKRIEETTTSYTANHADDHYFGIICGSLSGGTITRVSVNGESLSVVQAVQESANASTMTETVTTPIYHYYEVGSKDNIQEEAVEGNATVSFDAPDYYESDTSVRSGSNPSASLFTLQVSAPSDVQSREDGSYEVTYTLNVKSLSGTISNVTLKAGHIGNWSGGESASNNTVKYTLDSVNESGTTVTFTYTSAVSNFPYTQDMTFSASAQDSAGQTVPVSTGISTSILDGRVGAPTVASNAPVAENALNLAVSYPQTVEAGANGTASWKYTVTITNNSDKQMKNVTVEDPMDATVTTISSRETNGNITIAANQSVTVEFSRSHTLAGTGVSEVVYGNTVSVTAVVGEPGQKVTASSGNASDGITIWRAQDTSNTGDDAREASVRLTITAPDAAMYVADGIGKKATVEYKIKAENLTGSALSNVSITPIKVAGGKWSSVPSGANNATGVYTISSLNADNPVELTYVVEYTGAETSVDFSCKMEAKISSETRCAEASVTTKMYDGSEDNLIQGQDAEENPNLELKVSYPKVVKADKNGSAKWEYEVTLKNNTNNTMQDVTIGCPSGITISFLDGTTNGKISVERTGQKTIKLTGSTTLTENEQSITDNTFSASYMTGQTTVMAKASGEDSKKIILWKETSEPKIGDDSEAVSIQVSVTAPDKVAYQNGNSQIKYTIIAENLSDAELTGVTLTPSVQGGTWKIGESETAGGSNSVYTIDSLSKNNPVTLTYTVNSSGTDAQNFTCTMSANGRRAAADVTSAKYNTSLKTVYGFSAATAADQLTVSAEAVQNQLLTSGGGITYKVNVTAPSGKEVKVTATMPGTWSEEAVGDNNSTVTITGTGGVQTLTYVYQPENAGECIIDFSAESTDGMLAAGTASCTVNAFTSMERSSAVETASITEGQLNLSIISPTVVDMGADGNTVVRYTLAVENQTGESVTITAPENGTWSENPDQTGTSQSSTYTIAGNGSGAVYYTRTVPNNSLSFSGGKASIAAATFHAETANADGAVLKAEADSDGIWVYDRTDLSRGAQHDVKATLTRSSAYVVKGSRITYTLTLENLISDPIHIITDLRAWGVQHGSGWSTQEHDLTNGNTLTDQILEPGASVTLENNTLPTEGISVSITAGKITTTPVPTYQYIPRMKKVGTAETPTVRPGTAIYAGDNLYAGALTGIVSSRSVSEMNVITGTISQCSQDLEVIGVKDSNVTNGASVTVGGVAGRADEGSSLTDLYVKGSASTRNGADAGAVSGSGDISPATSIYPGSSDTEPGTDWTNWTSFRHYDSVDSYADDFDLSWLVKSIDFVDEKNDVGLSDARVNLIVEQPMTDKNISYQSVYHARKALVDQERQSYFSDSASWDLGMSGYYEIVHVYATDGYYHYVQDGAKTDGTYQTYYPYHSDITERPKIAASNDPWEVRRASDSLEDSIYLKLSVGISDDLKIYYNDNTEPLTAVNNEVKFPFTESNLTIDATPVLDEGSCGEKIYEKIPSRTFKAEDRDPLPEPKVTVTGYYEMNGQAKEETFTSGKAYVKGSTMSIKADALGEGNQYAYWFSSKSPEEISEENWTGNRWTGTSDIPDAAWTEYRNSLKIPDTLSGKNYLYVKVTRANYPDTVYCIGDFVTDSMAEVTPKVYYNYMNEPEKYILNESGQVVEGDILVFECQNSSRLTQLEYVISGTALTGDSLYQADWKTYSGPVTITDLNDSTYCYIYTRMKEENAGSSSGTAYGPVSSYEYTFAGESGKVQASPRTVEVQTEQDVSVAAAVSSGSPIYLDSTSEDVKILYTTSDSFTGGITLTRVSGDVSGLSEGGRYFKAGQRWYMTDQDGVKIFEDQVVLYNETNAEQTQYICAIALGEDLAPSAAVTYAYRVQTTEQAYAPESTLVTRYYPDGTDKDIALVSKGSQLSFTSLTPGADLYYVIGNGTVSDHEDSATGTRKYDSSEGVLVEGDYGSQFVVSIKAVKWNSDRTRKELKDSETIRYVFEVADQELAQTPTSTPVTSSADPVTVIPGDKILLSTATKGGTIYYTTDGTAPQVSQKEDGSFEAADSSTRLYDAGTGISMPSEGTGYFTIRAITVHADLGNSPEAQFVYSFPDTVQSPYANVPSGSVDLGTEIILKNKTSGATIYYTIATGGKTPVDPTISSAVFDEEQPVVIQEQTAIKAIAVKDGVKSAVATFTYNSMDQLPAPTASIDSGAMVSRGTTLQLDAADGATIYYTTDGSDPKAGGNAAVISGNRLTLDGASGDQVTVKAYAKKDGKSDSEVVTFTYQISQTASGVTADPASGTLVSNGTKVNLMTDVTGADIYYSTDGTDPQDGTKGTVVTINGTPGSTFTIKAVAVVDKDAGAVATFTYRIKEKPTAPTASPSGGVLTVATRVELNSSADKIYYTTDGTTPTESSNLYKEPILINRTTNLKAIAVSEDGEISDVSSFQYTAAQKAKMPEATYEDGMTLEPGTVVTLRSETSDAVIYYSTDGTDPTLDNLDGLLEYTEDGISINRTVTIKAVAYREDLQLSAIGEFRYVVETIPAVEYKQAEAEKLAAESLHDTDASSLEREKDYDGTAYKSRILENKEYKTVISSTWDAIPSDAVLVTEEEDYTEMALRNVKRLFGDEYVILSSYDICLKKGSTVVQPSGEVEIGIPIPEKYLDAAVTVVHIDSDNKITKLDTRRSDGTAYAKVSHFSHYALVGLLEEEQGGWTLNYLLILEAAAVLTFLCGLIYLIRQQWKKFHRSC